MKANELHPPKGATHKRKKIGRGVGSGHGTYSCRGLKGQNCRSGGGVHPLFEGGQNPLVKRLPYKRGFNNKFRVDYCVINLDRLNSFPDGTEVTPEILVSAGIIKKHHKPVKILGEGELTSKIIIKANKFSKSAVDKIQSAGGSAEVIA